MHVETFSKHSCGTEVSKHTHTHTHTHIYIYIRHVLTNAEFVLFSRVATLINGNFPFLATHSFQGGKLPFPTHPRPYGISCTCSTTRTVLYVSLHVQQPVRYFLHLQPVRFSHIGSLPRFFLPTFFFEDVHHSFSE